MELERQEGKFKLHKVPSPEPSSRTPKVLTSFWPRVVHTRMEYGKVRTNEKRFKKTRKQPALHVLGLGGPWPRG